MNFHENVLVPKGVLTGTNQNLLSRLNRRSFIKGLLSLAAAPLAVTVFPPADKLGAVSTITIRKMEDLLVHNTDLAKELSRRGLKINYSALHKAIFESSGFTA